MSNRNTNLSCDIVQDLLLLYDDDACSESTRRAVEEHLAGCEKCRKNRLTAMVPPIEKSPAETKAIKLSFKKVHRRWIASILAVLMLFPLTAMIVLGYHEVTGKGRTLSNWDEIKAGEEVLEMLAEGNYDGVVERTTFHFEYEEAVRLSEQTYDDYIDENYCSRYQEIAINGEPWVYREESFGNYVSDPTVDGAGIDWEYLLYDSSAYMCYIPEDIFREVTHINNLTVNSDGIATAKVKTNYRGSEIYYRLETEWGTFMVSENTWESLHMPEMKGIDFLDPINLTSSLLAPESLYLDTVEAMKKDKHSYSHDYKPQTEAYSMLVADGEEAFYAGIAEVYKENLKALDDREFEITNITYDSSYRVDGEWIVSYYVTLDCPDGKVLPNDYTVKVDFKTYDGKVRFAGYTYNILGKDYHYIGWYNHDISLFADTLASDNVLQDMWVAIICG